MTGDSTAGSKTLPTTPSKFTAPTPDADEGGADQAAEQRVRRAGGQPEQPGEQVPEDGADQPGEDDRSA